MARASIYTPSSAGLGGWATQMGVLNATNRHDGLYLGVPKDRPSHDSLTVVRQQRELVLERLLDGNMNIGPLRQVAAISWRILQADINDRNNNSTGNDMAAILSKESTRRLKTMAFRRPRFYTRAFMAMFVSALVTVYYFITRNIVLKKGT
ncbi:hypothetical protein H109_06251 [Trichophyton interdigitale MR816]|uniref:Uncharacterized protein n=1 Tax=Trichophyton interdigitale (strain MR816) TaxID=1215338 RepID=A0A059J1N5_TRIIM|nr:hypothetical protein H109_06251 [Trichophyton interdigitale MR816]